MQLPSVKTPIDRCEEVSLYTQRMLGKFPAEPLLAGLAATLEGATATLVSSQSAYAAAIKGLIVVRVDVKFADYASDRGVRLALRRVELADGAPGGRFASHLYPKGVTPIIRPIGNAQVSEMVDLEGRYEALSASWPEAASEKAAIAAFRMEYEGALAARKDGMQNASNLRSARNIAKEDFLDTFVKVAARVREAYPRDKKMQDLFFDKLQSRVTGEDDDEGDGASPEVAPVEPAGG